MKNNIKKIFLIAATSTALLSSFSSLAECTNEEQLYIKVEAGAAKFNKMKIKDLGFKLKSNTSAIVGLGVGYNIMENIRTDLTFNYVINPQFKNKKSDVVPGSTVKLHLKDKPRVMSLLLNGYVDLFDISVVKIFAGAGVGVSYIKDKGKYKIGEAKEESVSAKKKYGFAFQASVGASTEIAPGVKADLAYSYRDYNKGKKLKDISEKKFHLKSHNVTAGLRFDI